MQLQLYNWQVWGTQSLQDTFLLCRAASAERWQRGTKKCVWRGEAAPAPTTKYNGPICATAGQGYNTTYRRMVSDRIDEKRSMNRSFYSRILVYRKET